MTPEAEKGSPAIETPRPLPPPVHAEADLLLDDQADQAEAEAAFLSAFGADPTETVIRKDAAGDNLVVGPALFRDVGAAPIELSAELVSALPLVARALQDPAEIRAVWRQGPPRLGGPLSMLVRRFIARFDVAGQLVDVVVDVGNAGWSARTSLDKGGLDIQDWRRGLVLWPPSSAHGS